MKSVIKTTLGILAISLASISVSQADSKRHDRNFEQGQHKHYSKKFDRRDERKFRKHQHRDNHYYGHRNHPRWKHTGWKRHYLEHKMERKRLRAIKRMHRQERRALKHMYREREYRRALRREHRHNQLHHNHGHVRYIAPVQVAPAPRVTYRSYTRSNVVPVIAGGIIGSSIANSASHGDPAATLGGAIFGAVIGDAIANH